MLHDSYKIFFIFTLYLSKSQLIRAFFTDITIISRVYKTNSLKKASKNQQLKKDKEKPQFSMTWVRMEDYVIKEAGAYTLTSTHLNRTVNRPTINV